MKTKIYALLSLSLTLGACSGNAPKSDTISEATRAEPKSIPLTITSNGKAHQFEVEVAATPEAQAQGLMFRKELGADRGMVFPMKPPRTASFWMKNTVIPLDMLFIAPNGTIAFIGANRKPYSREPASAGVPVSGVLELRGGRASELGIVEGDKVQWGACAVPAAAPTKLAIASNFCP